MNSAVLLLTVHWLLAGIFAVALLHKVRARQRFSAALGAYDLVPEFLLGAATPLILLGEALTVVLLLVMQPVGAVLAGVLLGVYALAMAISVLRGRTHIDCGCGDEPAPVSWALVMRNLSLIALGLWALQMHATAPLAAGVGWVAGLVALALAVVALGIYQAIEQLFANRGRHQRLWQGVN